MPRPKEPFVGVWSERRRGELPWCAMTARLQCKEKKKKEDIKCGKCFQRKLGLY